jgi:hypothetical protein
MRQSSPLPLSPTYLADGVVDVEREEDLVGVNGLFLAHNPHDVPPVTSAPSRISRLGVNVHYTSWFRYEMGRKEGLWEAAEAVTRR